MDPPCTLQKAKSEDKKEQCQLFGEVIVCPHLARKGHHLAARGATALVPALAGMITVN